MAVRLARIVRWMDTHTDRHTDRQCQNYTPSADAGCNDDGANYRKRDFEGGGQGVIIGYDIICIRGIDEGWPVTAAFFCAHDIEGIVDIMNRRAMGLSGNRGCKH